jgi:hypothetical protein
MTCGRAVEAQSGQVFQQKILQTNFFVAKKDGGVQIVKDFWAINQQNMVDKYSMRDVQECIDKIGRAGSSIQPGVQEVHCLHNSHDWSV